MHVSLYTLPLVYTSWIMTLTEFVFIPPISIVWYSILLSSSSYTCWLLSENSIITFLTLLFFIYVFWFLLNGEYALHFAIGKTYEGAEKVEFIDGKKYILNHYLDDIYEDNSTIKDIGELSLNVDNLIGLLFDFEEEDEEIVISVVDFEHGGGLSNPRIREVDDSGDIENILKELIEKFSE